MPFISASAISPYNSIRGGAAGGPSILDFSPYNVWDSEHITINGTDTTFEDFNNVGAAYDLANPAATNQPTYNSSDSDFNNLPSFTFDGVDDYLINNLSNYRTSDNSGMMVCVIKSVSNKISPMFSFGAGAGTIRMSLRTNLSRQLQFIKLGGTGGNVFPTSSAQINNTDSFVLVMSSTGSSWKMFINETNVSFGGTNNGLWLSSYSTPGTLNNISIGASVSGSIINADAKIAMCGYFPYVSDTKTVEIINFLKTKYGIS